MIKTIRYSRLKALIFWFHCSFKLPLYQGLCVSFGGLVVSLGASSLGIPLWILTRFALSRPHLPKGRNSRSPGRELKSAEKRKTTATCNPSQNDSIAKTPFSVNQSQNFKKQIRLKCQYEIRHKTSISIRHKLMFSVCIRFVSEVRWDPSQILGKSCWEI